MELTKEEEQIIIARRVFQSRQFNYDRAEQFLDTEVSRLWVEFQEQYEQITAILHAAIKNQIKDSAFEVDMIRNKYKQRLDLLISKLPKEVRQQVYNLIQSQPQTYEPFNRLLITEEETGLLNEIIKKYKSN